ncbi:Hypothetical predicted protein [Pelobates cultripes]|uniref:UPAR/Ly6 domain-containing protein n=1 Tax=Pelobates cultripes TaxID=61616 RepID=A0AAD1T3L1_PELCU|nr:Hypothetical predicted protein [Pelobates cultripes]
MNSILCAFCMILALLRTGNCLSCTLCLVQGTTFCTGNNVTCDNGRVCISTHTVSTEDGIKKNEFFGRTCMPQHYCNNPGSFSTDKSNSRKGISCCETDNCVPPAPILPDVSDKPNGVICKTCTADDTEWCDTKQVKKCTGDENKCIVQIATMSGAVSRKTVLRGCATQSICNIGNETVTTDGISVIVSISCTDGCKSLYRGSSFQTLLAFALFLSLGCKN